MLSRRELLRGAAAAAGAALVAPMLNRGRYRLFAHSTDDYSARTIALMQRSLVIDMLAVFTLDFPLQAKWAKAPESFTAADYQKFKSSGITIFHPAVGIGGTNAYEQGLQFFGGWNSFIAGSDQYLLRIDSPADFERIKASGRIGVILGVQNAEHFRRPDDVDAFHGLGQRVAQLTYNRRNLIGNGSTERRDEGLSDFGVAIVERMNGVG
jgi:membrane dipeptidase